MANFGSFDISGLQELQNNLNKLSTTRTHEFMEACVKELAMRLLRSVKKRTPVGVYPKKSGKVGGTLRRGWSVDENVISWADNADISVNDGVYSVVVINPVEYASYVEYGHRTKSGGFVPGRFMLKISEDELKSILPQVLEKKISDFLGRG